MAKDSFILYTEQIEIFENLTDKQAGMLIKAIFAYISGNEEADNKLPNILKMAFIPIKQQIDRNSKKWDDIRKKRSEAGKRHSGNQYTRQKMEQMEQNGTSGTNGTVNVNVNDNVNVNESVCVINNTLIENTSPPPTLDELRSYCFANFMEDFDYEHFYNHYKSVGWKDKNGNEIENWQSKVNYWYQEDKTKGKLIKKQDTSRRLE